MKQKQVALLVAGGLAILAGVLLCCAVIIGWDVESVSAEGTVMRESTFNSEEGGISLKIKTGDELTTGMVIAVDDGFEVSGYLGTLGIVGDSSDLITLQGVPRGAWQEEKIELNCSDSKDYESLTGKLVLAEYNSVSHKLERLQALDSTQLVHGRVISIKLGDSDEVVVSLTDGTSRTLSLKSGYYCEGTPTIASDILGYFVINEQDELLMFVAA